MTGGDVEPVEIAPINGGKTRLEIGIPDPASRGRSRQREGGRRWGV